MSSKQSLFDYCLDLIDEREHSSQEDIEWKGAGYCCFCNDECNPASQSCGRCKRNGSMYSVKK